MYNFIIAILLLNALSAPASSGIEAKSAILMNTKSESVLFAQSEDVPIPPASLAKIMTMHIVMNDIDSGQASLSDMVKISRRAAIQPGSRMNLREGETVVMDELLKGVAVASGNDAAVAVAEHVAGSVEAFVKRMNAEAGALGMKSTIYRNPNGLPSKEQVTTARDTLTLTKNYIESHPDAMSYHKILEITHRGTTTTNKNPLLKTHPLVDGLKTGWIRASNHNLITTAKSGDIRLISVVLGAPTSRDLTDESAFLIDAGFRTVESGGKIKVIHQLEERVISGDKILISDDKREPSEEPLSADISETTEEFHKEAVPVREIDASEVERAVATLCVEANYLMSPDIKAALSSAAESETNELASEVLGSLLENAEIASEGTLPLCQDTGMAVIFVEIGQDVRVVGGSLRDAINNGVRRGYKEGYLRASVVSDPIDRVNTGDNTPAVIHFNIVPGDKLRIIASPKGFGSENMSRLAMLTPSQGIAGIKEFVIDTVKMAGPNPCPPIIVGVGIGGTMDYAAFMAKHALLRPLDSPNERELWNGIENDLLAAINSLDIGPAGLGGRTTALAVKIETFPTHIAGLPVAVNIGCHSTRHVEITL
jgi:fumarate hydratase subunit alpha